ncbi:MAG: hypothetical protein IPQ07_45685 [Myxococcales bacterium]|nr:hypothetical protein [Myxococcales bacterium]
MFYRVNRDWMLIGTLFITHQTLTHNDVDPAMPTVVVPKQDPSVNGVSGLSLSGSPTGSDRRHTAAHIEVLWVVARGRWGQLD